MLLKSALKCFKLYIFSEPLLSYDHHQCSAERGDQHQHPSLRHRLAREVERGPEVGGSLRQHVQDAVQPWESRGASACPNLVFDQGKRLPTYFGQDWHFTCLEGIMLTNCEEQYD